MCGVLSKAYRSEPSIAGSTQVTRWREASGKASSLSRLTKLAWRHCWRALYAPVLPENSGIEKAGHGQRDDSHHGRQSDYRGQSAAQGGTRERSEILR